MGIPNFSYLLSLAFLVTIAALGARAQLSKLAKFLTQLFPH